MKQLRILLILLLAGSNGHAQWQLGVSGGIAHYQGDLADRLFHSSLARPAFGLHAKYELSDRILLRGGLTFAQVAGDDQYLKKDYLRLRNLNFASNITELSVAAEVHTFRLTEKRWSPYVFGGLALYRFNPYTFDQNNEKVYLKPLSTEGQGLPDYPESKPYSLTQVALPFGGGIRFNVSDRLLLGVELGFRKLFTDYLDDVSTNYADADDLFEYRGIQAVSLAYRGDEIGGGNPLYPAKGSQRGGSNQKDFFYLAGLSLSIRLGDGALIGGGNGRGGRRSNFGCPKVPM